MIMQTCLLFADDIETQINTLHQQAFKSNDLDEKINLNQKILSIIKSNIDEDGLIHAAFPDDAQAFTALIQLYIEKHPEISLNELLNKIDYLDYKNHSIEFDLNGDGKNELLINYREFGIILAELNGKVQYLHLRSWVTEISKFIELDRKNKVVLLLSSGGNGAGASVMTLVGIKDNELKELFVTPSSFYSGNSLKDIDNDRQEEIVCYETIEYKRLYWPRIYKWDGQNYTEVTLNFPQIMIDEYKGLIDLARRREIDEILHKRSPEYLSFWTKYLKPIKDDEGFKDNMFSESAEDMWKDIERYFNKDNSKVLRLADKLLLGPEGNKYQDSIFDLVESRYFDIEDFYMAEKVLEDLNKNYVHNPNNDFKYYSLVLYIGYVKYALLKTKEADECFSQVYDYLNKHRWKNGGIDQKAGFAKLCKEDIRKYGNILNTIKFTDITLDHLQFNKKWSIKGTGLKIIGKYVLVKENSNVTYYSIDTGKIRWSFDLDIGQGDIRDINIIGNILIIPLHAYDKKKGCRIIALNKNNGRELWHFENKEQLNRCLMSPDNKTLIVSTWYDLFALDVHSGKQLWQFNDKGYYYEPVLAATNKTVLLGTGKDYYGLNLENGSIKWSYKSQDQLINKYVSADSNAYIPYRERDIKEFPEYLADFHGSSDLSYNLKTVDIDSGIIQYIKKYGESSISSLVKQGGKLLIGADGAVNCLEVNSGKTLWTWSNMRWMPFITDEKSVYKYFQNRISCVDLKTGIPLWIGEIQPQPEYLTHIYLVNDYLCIGCNDRTLNFYNKMTGVKEGKLEGCSIIGNLGNIVLINTGDEISAMEMNKK